MAGWTFPFTGKLSPHGVSVPAKAAGEQSWWNLTFGFLTTNSLLLPSVLEPSEPPSSSSCTTLNLLESCTQWKFPCLCTCCYQVLYGGVGGWKFWITLCMQGIKEKRNNPHLPISPWGKFDLSIYRILRRRTKPIYHCAGKKEGSSETCHCPPTDSRVPSPSWAWASCRGCTVGVLASPLDRKPGSRHSYWTEWPELTVTPGSTDLKGCLWKWEVLALVSELICPVRHATHPSFHLMSRTWSFLILSGLWLFRIHPH